MCRELKREPAWVAAIKLALTKGTVDVDSVIEEANLVPGRERTVLDILSTMVDRELLQEASNGAEPPQYVPGPVLYKSAPTPAAAKYVSTDGAHRWNRESAD